MSEEIKLPIVVSIEDEEIENEDAVAYDKERADQRAESRNAPSEGFDPL